MRLLDYFSKRIRNNNEDNNGSVLVTVLVAFLFVSILVTMVMTATAVNFRMRAIDRGVKDEFYYAEKGLNDIYTGVGLKSSEVMGSTYNKVLSNEGGTYGYKVENESEAIRRFNKLFADSMKTELTKEKMSKFIVDKRAYLDSEPVLYYRYLDSSGSYQDTLNLEPSFDYLSFQAIIVKNVSVVSKNADKEYVSAVTSDIVINTPMVDFITVNKRELEYAIIANDGIFVNGDTTISGSIYGGELTSGEISQTDFGGININNSKLTLHSRYVISGGNINVNGGSGSLIINNNNTQCDVWFENMNVYSKSLVALDAKADFYALDDLAVYGDGANVKLVGNYYGYNDGSLKLKEKDFVIDRNDAASIVAVNKENDSSSLIVNARNVTVDMKGVDTFVMLGKAYINHSSKQSDASPVVFDMDAEYRNIMTGQSVASKAEQEIYLVPGEFLNVSNPSVIETIDPFEVSIPNDWFAKQYLDATEPTRTIIVKKGATSYGYCYLNFKDDANRVAYLKRIIPYANVRVWDSTQLIGPDTSAEATAVSPTPEEIYNRILAIDASQGGNIFIGEDYVLNNSGRDEDDIHIYSPYGIVQNTVAENDKGYSVMLKTNDLGVERFADYKTNMYNKYSWFDTYLDPQEQRSLTTFDKDSVNVNNYNWAFNTVTDDDMDNAGLPLSRLIWVGDSSNYYDGSRNLGGLGHLSAGVYQDPNVDPADEEAVKNKLPGKVIVSKGDYTLANSIDGFVLVDGDVLVKNGVKVNGFIFATGKITFEGNNEVKFNSALMEQRIEKETDKVKDALRNGETSPYKNYYLISYLLNVNPRSTGIATITDNPIKFDDVTGKVTWGYLKYNYGNDADMQAASGINTDYRSYVVYENWKKGQIQ